MLADIQSDAVAAQALAREAHQIYQQLGDTRAVATTMHALARQAQLRGRYADARSLLLDAVALWDQIGERTAADMATSNLATVARAEGDYDLARSLFEQLRTSAATRGDRRGVASALNELGEVAASQSADDVARRHYRDSLAMFRQIDDRWGVARVLTDLASIDIRAGDHAAAARSLTEALHISRTHGQPLDLRAQALYDVQRPHRYVAYLLFGEPSSAWDLALDDILVHGCHAPPGRLPWRRALPRGLLGAHAQGDDERRVQRIGFDPHGHDGRA